MEEKNNRAKVHGQRAPDKRTTVSTDLEVGREKWGLWGVQHEVRTEGRKST